MQHAQTRAGNLATDLRLSRNAKGSAAMTHASLAAAQIRPDTQPFPRDFSSVLKHAQASGGKPSGSYCPYGVRASGSSGSTGGSVPRSARTQKYAVASVPHTRPTTTPPSTMPR